MIRVAAVIATIATIALPSIVVAQDSRSRFLVATPDLRDPLFSQTVVVMIPQSEIQIPLVVGLIINKPTQISVKEVFPNVTALKDPTIYFGGPVDTDQPSLLFRTSQPPEGAVQVTEDLYLSIDPKAITEMLKDPKLGQARIFLGRSQWSQDQLRAETAEGSWYSAPADISMVFSGDPKGVWRKLADRGQLQEVEGTPPLRLIGFRGVGFW